MCNENYTVFTCDVESANLYGDLDKEVYMKAPADVVVEADECLLLERSIYGPVQSGRQWWKKLSYGSS